MDTKSLARLQPHTFAVLVNKLTQTASEFAGTGQLRERMAGALTLALRPCTITKALQALDAEYPRMLYAIETLPDITILKVPRKTDMSTFYAALDKHCVPNRTIPAMGHAGPDYDSIYIKTGHISLNAFETGCSGHRSQLMYELNRVASEENV